MKYRILKKYPEMYVNAEAKEKPKCDHRKE